MYLLCHHCCADALTGDIMAKLEEYDIDEDTLIDITADHGFDEGPGEENRRHHDAPYIFLATNDPEVMRPGTLLEIAPTVLKRFGLNLGEIDPPLYGSPLTEPE